MSARHRPSLTTKHSVLCCFYREVLSIDFPWLNNIGRPQQTKRIPSVLTKDELAGLLAQMDGVNALLARLLYGMSRHHNLTGIPRLAMCCLACPTVNSP